MTSEIGRGPARLRSFWVDKISCSLMGFKVWVPNVNVRNCPADVFDAISPYDLSNSKPADSLPRDYSVSGEVWVKLFPIP